MKDSLLLLCIFLCGITAFPQFRSQIPNGLVVPHPCRPSAIWRGVGHRNVLGGGTRNQFGVDFFENDGVSQCISYVSVYCHNYSLIDTCHLNG